MIICDINVLVAAFRQDHPQHQSALSWLTQAINGEEALGIPDSVWSGFLRIVTHHKIFVNPAPLAEAFEFVRAVDGASASTRIGVALDLSILEEICTDAGATADLIPDAYLAGLAASLGASIASFDRDFRRFDAIRTIDPGDQFKS